MSPARELLEYAAECRDLAAQMGDLEEQAAWNRMADKLLRCAELAAHESSHAHPFATLVPSISGGFTRHTVGR